MSDTIWSAVISALCGLLGIAGGVHLTNRGLVLARRDEREARHQEQLTAAYRDWFQVVEDVLQACVKGAADAAHALSPEEAADAFLNALAVSGRCAAMANALLTLEGDRTRAVALVGVFDKVRATVKLLTSIRPSSTDSPTEVVAAIGESAEAVRLMQLELAVALSRTRVAASLAGGFFKSLMLWKS